MLTRRFFNTPAWDFDVTKPFAEIERLRRRMDQLFDQMMPPAWKAGRTMGVFPLVNLTEDRESYILRAEIPGVTAENLNIQATAKSVSISGERHIPQEGENMSATTGGSAKAAGFHGPWRYPGRSIRTGLTPSLKTAC